MAPKKMKKPKKAKRKSGTGGPFICPLCNKGFSRRATVKEPHFGTCVARLGNPHRLPWDAHQSCWAKRPGRRPGPSGTAAPGVERILAEDKDKEEEEEEEEEDGDEDMQSEANEIEGEHNGLEERMAANIKKEDYEREDEGDIKAVDVSTGWSSINIPQIPVQNNGLPSPKHSSDPEPLSAMVMNQLVNIPITSSRVHAGKGDLEAIQIWELWNAMVPPENPLPTVQPPWIGSGQKLRQQSVVWLAQDVYSLLLSRARGLGDQLRMVLKWREITSDLDDAAGVAKIHDILIKALGEEGPLMLSG